MVEKIKPLRDRVLIRRAQEEEKTEGGIFIPDAAKERGQKGKVIEVGAQVAEVKVGDVVLFGKYAGTDASADYLIIKEEEILGVVKA